ncbi:MAG: hypothetical protein K0R03_1749 [Moraxellaceae bacterium]|jgi:hypothetical protein|nr:hypothetical protein [Moraxellaceae bacterium]MDF3031191.1 hypothetical protein [Moraxellaceae bacterium]
MVWKWKKESNHRKQAQAGVGGRPTGDSAKHPPGAPRTDTLRHRFLPDEVELYLGGTKYPASRQHLLDRAASNGAAPEIINALQGLPERSYRSAADVISAVSRLL